MTREEKRLNYIRGWLRELLLRELPNPDVLVEENGMFVFEVSDNVFKLTIEDLTEPASIATMGQVVERQIKRRRRRGVQQSLPGFISRTQFPDFAAAHGCTISTPSLARLHKLGLLVPTLGSKSVNGGHLPWLYPIEEATAFVKQYPKRTWTALWGGLRPRLG